MQGRALCSPRFWITLKNIGLHPCRQVLFLRRILNYIRGQVVKEKQLPRKHSIMISSRHLFRLTSPEFAKGRDCRNWIQTSWDSHVRSKSSVLIWPLYMLDLHIQLYIAKTINATRNLPKLMCQDSQENHNVLMYFSSCACMSKSIYIEADFDNVIGQPELFCHLFEVRGPKSNNFNILFHCFGEATDLCWDPCQLAARYNLRSWIFTDATGSLRAVSTCDIAVKRWKAAIAQNRLNRAHWHKSCE